MWEIHMRVATRYKGHNLWLFITWFTHLTSHSGKFGNKRGARTESPLWFQRQVLIKAHVHLLREFTTGLKGHTTLLIMILSRV